MHYQLSGIFIGNLILILPCGGVQRLHVHFWGGGGGGSVIGGQFWGVSYGSSTVVVLLHVADSGSHIITRYNPVVAMYYSSYT